MFEGYKISIIGAGAWGTAMAKHLADKGFEVILWAREKEVKEAIDGERENTIFLPKVQLPENIYATNFLIEALAGKRIIIFAVPSQYIRNVLEETVGFIANDALLLNTAKGIETGTNKPMQQVFQDIFSRQISARYVTLSGPSFALEVAQHQPTSVAIASVNDDLAKFICRLFSNGSFGALQSRDVSGVELGGAVKNVMAIAVGIAEGLGLGCNAKAIIINKALSEMIRLGTAMGAKAETFLGPAGIGDLVLTCTGHLSRNRALGVRIGQGENAREILSELSNTVEGVHTCHALKKLALHFDVSMPVAEQVFAVLEKNKNPREAIFEIVTKVLY